MPTSIDDYIAGFPPEVQAILQKIRAMIRAAVPEAEERISYRMPVFSLKGDLLYFAAFKKHIGIYPPVQGDEKLRRDLAPYRGEKGNLKFPLAEPMPYSLIGRVIAARLAEHRAKLAAKRARK